MSAIQTIQEYLVSLGFEVDKNAWHQANTAMDGMGKTVEDLGKKFEKLPGLEAFDKKLQKTIDLIHGHVHSVRKAGEALQNTPLFKPKPGEKKPWFMGGEDTPETPHPMADNPHVQKVKGALNTVGESMKKVGGILEGIFAGIDVGAILITGAIAAIVAAAIAAVAAIAIAIAKAIAGFMDGIAQTEMRAHKLSLTLFMGLDRARSLQETMDAMGLKSLEDLKFVALDPEKKKQFLGLNALAYSLKPSEDTKEGLKNIRLLGYEFQKFGIVWNAFWRSVAGEMGIIIGPMVEIVRIVGKLFSIVGKILGIGGGGPFSILLSSLNSVYRLVTFLLDQVDKLLGVVDKGAGWLSNKTQPTGLAANFQEDPLRAAAYYLLKIFEWLREAGAAVMRFVDSLPWVKAQREAAAQMTQLGNRAKGKDPAYNNAMQKAWHQLFGGSEHPGSLGHGFLQWHTSDASSPAINAFRTALGKGLGAFQITAGMTAHGHEPHGDHPRGLAFDIGLGGKSEASIVALVKRTIATKGWRILDLELAHAKYARVLADLQNQGISTRGIVNEPGHYRTGDNLHIGLQPITQHNTIHVHGKNAEEVAKTVDKHLQDRARRGYRGVPA